MKKTGHITSLAALALTSALFLAACGNGNHQAQTSTSSSVKTSSSSAKKTSTSSSKKASSSLEKSEAGQSSSAITAASSTASATDAAAPANNQAGQAATKQEPAQPAPSDYAYLAGTWANDEGVTLTFNADGTISNGAKIEGRDGSLGVRFKEGYGASLFYAAAGQEFPESIAPKEFTEGTDISKERLVIAQSVNEMAHPFYRVQ